MTLDKNHLNQVEYNISPPLAVAITIPVTGREGIAIYVAQSAFSAHFSLPATLADLRKVADKLELKP